MTEHANSSFDTTHDLLATTRAFARRVRDAQRGTWFPLALFGVATLVSAPFDRYGRSRTCTNPNRATHVCSVYSTGAFIYWPTVLVLIYVAIAWFYVRRASDRGVGTRIKPYVVAGVVVALALTAVSAWVITHPSTSGRVFDLPVQPGNPLGTALLRLVSPGAAIGLALLVLARIERNGALLAFTVAYLAVVLFVFPPKVTHSLIAPHPAAWYFLPRILIDAGVLLLGSACFAIAARASRRSAP